MDPTTILFHVDPKISFNSNVNVGALQVLYLDREMRTLFLLIYAALAGKGNERVSTVGQCLLLLVLLTLAPASPAKCAESTINTVFNGKDRRIE
jgi:hypothetical protein